MTETQLTSKLKADLLTFNCKVYVLAASMRQTKGVSDRFICHSLWCGTIEFKGPKTGVTSAQKRFIMDANRDGITKAVMVRFTDPNDWTKGLINDAIEWSSPRGLLEALAELRKKDYERKYLGQSLE